MGLNPCVLVLPLVFGAASRGATAIALVLAAYSATTVVLMVGLSVVGVRGARRIELPGAARHMETISGLGIALAGALFWWLER